MPFSAMSISSDSQNLPPLNCSPDERPPVMFTAAALIALRDSSPTLAIRNDPTQLTYSCPFCNSECTRDFCWGCHSELLEDYQDE